MGSTTVADDGSWSLPAHDYGSTKTYDIEATQSRDDGRISTVQRLLFPPTHEPVKVTDTVVGRPDAGGATATFTGTATAYSTVTIASTTTGEVFQTVEVDRFGQWSSRGNWDRTRVYDLTISAKAVTGEVETLHFGEFQAVIVPIG